MMDHYSLLLEIAHQRQQELLRQAETGHLYKRLKQNRPGLLQQIGHHVTDAVWQLKTNTHSNPATAPILDHK